MPTFILQWHGVSLPDCSLPLTEMKNGKMEGSLCLAMPVQRHAVNPQECRSSHSCAALPPGPDTQPR